MKTAWVSRFKIVLHVLLGLLLGSCIAMVYLASTQRFRSFVQMRIEEQFRQEMGLQFRCNIDSIDWLSCHAQISTVHISSLPDVASELDEQSWSIMAEKVTVKGSWWSLLLGRALKVTMQFDHVIMMELFEHTPEKLSVFLRQMFTKIGSTWIAYESISVRDGLLYLKRASDGLYVQIPYVSNMQSNASVVKMQAYLQNGIVWYHDGMSVEQITGSLVCELPYTQIAQQLRGDLQMNYILNASGTEIPGFLAGSMQHGRGEVTVKTEDGSVVIDPINIECSGQHCWCDMRVQATPDIFHHFAVPEFVTNFAGFVGIEVKLDAYNIFQTLQVSVLLQELLYKSKPIMPGGKFTIQDQNQHGCSGVFHMNDKDWMKVDLQLFDDHQTMHVENIVALEILQSNGWTIQPGGCSAQVRRDADGNLHGVYTVAAEHMITQLQHTIQGSFYSKDGMLHGEGTIDDLTYHGQLQFAPEIIFKSFQLFNKQQELLVDFSTDESDHTYIVGAVDFAIIKSLVPEPFKMSFAQEGSFVGRGYVKDGVWHATVQTHYAHIRVPYVYNVIQNLSASCEVDFYKKNIVLKDVVVEWYEGLMFCQRATFWFDKYLNCTAVHVPIIFDKVMMSWNKGIYGLLSGRVLMSRYEQDKPYHVEGKLLLHKAEVRENILSPEFHEMMQQVAAGSSLQTLPDNVTFDIGILMHDALSIKTSFMSARAMIELSIYGTLQKPLVSGAVEIVDGTLHFPYKPLSIIGGKVVLVPEQPLDPVFELNARGKLKRYVVSLRAWGSALDPHIQFESQPHLSEEQILSLLMLGVEDQSLSLMVPAFLTQKLQEIMFGPAMSKTKLKAVFDRVLQSLKYVRFLPQFTSQAERGGMRGIFEIDASERLHGKIDTNFSTHVEDTRFDIDYDVADDVTLRLQKDGPSTYGGEVEFSWKFS